MRVRCHGFALERARPGPAPLPAEVRVRPRGRCGRNVHAQLVHALHDGGRFHLLAGARQLRTLHGLALARLQDAKAPLLPDSVFKK